jgi:hypothetical protein
MSKEGRVRRMLWVALIVAAVAGLAIAAPPTQELPVDWTGWTMA